ncbi:MAG: FAD-dependent oxidoreductase [Halobacteriales archaeon]|nr:FAD-dependent oxidoreductase [Halobacteriales archaeon]
MTETVAVVGGGSTGVGVARDLALRGVEVVLLEKGGLTNGATGHAHGLLHSGARYADRDAESARDCVAENRVLRDIAPNCLEATGGVFVELPEDPDGYFEEKVGACEDCGIPTRVLEGDELGDEYPYVADDAERGFEVPDAVVNPVRLVASNALDATRNGARVLTDAEVTDIVTSDGAVDAVEYVREDASKRTLAVDHVVNTAGAWAETVARMAGVEGGVGVRPSKGAMVAFDYETDAVVNRCRPSDNGDIVVPHGDISVAGTTDEEVENPDNFAREDWEVELMREEGARTIPALADAEVAYTYWGVRPLYHPSPETDGETETVDAPRGFAVLDHSETVEGFTSVVGGKLTTYRLMAERTADHVCSEMGVSADCETAERRLPDDEELDENVRDWGMDEASVF